ncbi:hypothetical protein [Streptomyces pseudovenezuelae]|jgi:hypothetical protein|uniref:Uncharacterized protein n=1 Tax=Streptomyces pseudovenezuelae TaxID=67350 RepID=A0ABT6LP48_9ACTN|nr:hypothetical protein [Streptomyces pseudovenezuelae]MDH6218023.1 hypothetical protein [Streptomyces pseudovenezuelae]
MPRSDINELGQDGERCFLDRAGSTTGQCNDLEPNINERSLPRNER